VIDNTTFFLRRTVCSVASISEKSRSALGESLHFSLFRHEVSILALMTARGGERPYADRVRHRVLMFLRPPSNSLPELDDYALSRRRFGLLSLRSGFDYCVMLIAAYAGIAPVLAVTFGELGRLSI
jgi:hypothetical protein